MAVNDSIITEHIYATVKGRKYAAWVDADSRNNGYNENDLIQNPAYIIESILRDELGLTSASINFASFDEVGNTTNGKRDDWIMRRSLTAQQNSLDVIDDICRNSGTVLVHDYANLERLVALDHYNPADILANADIAEENGVPMVRVRQTHTKYICNEFYLNYGLNYATGNYDKQLYITAAGQNLASNTRSDKVIATYGGANGLCDKSQDMYNVVRRWTFNSDWIHDDTTAEAFIKLMADWLAIRRWEVEATLWYNATTLKLEVMDQVTWNLDLLPISVRDSQISNAAAGVVGSAGSLADDTYYYCVSGVDPYGEGKNGNIVTVVVTGKAGAGSVPLTWSALADVTNYRVYRSTTETFDAGTTVYFETTDLSYTDTGAAGTAGTPITAAAAFFVSNVIDFGLKGGGRIKMNFHLLPQRFL